MTQTRRPKRRLGLNEWREALGSEGKLKVRRRRLSSFPGQAPGESTADGSFCSETKPLDPSAPGLKWGRDRRRICWPRQAVLLIFRVGRFPLRPPHRCIAMRYAQKGLRQPNVGAPRGEIQELPLRDRHTRESSSVGGKPAAAPPFFIEYGIVYCL